MSVRTDWHSCRHVLAIRLEGADEVLMTTPALRALRTAGAKRITLLGSPAGIALAPFIAEIDDAQACEPGWMKNRASGNEADLELVNRLRELKPDAVVIFTLSSQSALPAAMVCHLAGIPRILAHCRENPYRVITHWVRDDGLSLEGIDGMRHEVLRQLDLVAAVGAHTTDRAMSFQLRHGDRAELDVVLAANGISHPRGWIAVHTGKGRGSRGDAPQKLVETLVSLQGEGHRLVLLGEGDDLELQHSLASSQVRLPGLIDLTGQLSLGALAAALEYASVCICHDGSPAKIAAALGTPVVDIGTLMSAETSPWETLSRALTDDPASHSWLSRGFRNGRHVYLADAEAGPETVPTIPIADSATLPSVSQMAQAIDMSAQPAMPQP